jgi:hypothetical protein
MPISSTATPKCRTLSRHIHIISPLPITKSLGWGSGLGLCANPYRYPYRFQVQEEQASPKSYTRLNANSNASDLDGFLSLPIQVLLPRRSEVPRFSGSLV